MLVEYHRIIPEYHIIMPDYHLINTNHLIQRKIPNHDVMQPHIQGFSPFSTLHRKLAKENILGIKLILRWYTTNENFFSDYSSIKMNFCHDVGGVRGTLKMICVS